MPGFGFSRELRLTEPAQFKAVFNQADIKVSDRYLLVLARRNCLGVGRIGLVIGKKNLPKAFQRNRIKRLLRNTFRLNQSLLEGLDIVILARSNMSSLDNSQVSENISRLLLDLVKKNTTKPQTPTDRK